MSTYDGLFYFFFLALDKNVCLKSLRKKNKKTRDILLLKVITTARQITIGDKKINFFFKLIFNKIIQINKIKSIKNKELLSPERRIVNDVDKVIKKKKNFSYLPISFLLTILRS